jgi:hypothetical protein
MKDRVKKLFASLLIAIFFFSPSVAQPTGEDKPVEAWTVEKIENGKRIKVIKVRLESGKIVEVRPHLTKEKIPKPESKFSTGKEKFLEYVGLAIMVLIFGSGVFLLMRKK